MVQIYFPRFRWYRVKTIHGALAPLLITGSFCGLGFFEYPPGRLRPYHSCVYIFVTWGLYAYLFYYLVSVTDVKTIFISPTNVIVMIAATISMIVSLFRFKKLKSCLRKLSIVDDTLEVLGTPKEYQRLFNWMIFTIIVWIITTVFTNILDSLSLIFESYYNISRLYVPFVANHMLHVNTVSGLIWGTILGYTSSRFQRVNEHILNLLKDNARCDRQKKSLILIERRKPREVVNSRHFMWIIMHVHLQLCRITRELNEVFSTQMTLEMASLFTFFVELFINFYDLYVDEDKNALFEITETLIIYIWAIVFTVRLCALNYICQSVCDKANGTVAILHKLLNVDNPDKDLCEQAVQFIFQIKQKEVRFTGMGFFNFGNSFIRRFVLSIATVVVIIIQMHKSHPNIGNMII